MTIIAKRSVQLKGHIYSKGEAAEYDGPVDSRIAELFTDKDGKALVVDKERSGKDGGDKKLERVEALLRKLGRKGIEQKLDELGVSHAPKMADTQLAALLLQQQGEI